MGGWLGENAKAISLNLPKAAPPQAAPGRRIRKIRSTPFHPYRPIHPAASKGRGGGLRGTAAPHRAAWANHERYPRSSGRRAARAAGMLAIAGTWSCAPVSRRYPGAGLDRAPGLSRPRAAQPRRPPAVVAAPWWTRNYAGTFRSSASRPSARR